MLKLSIAAFSDEQFKIFLSSTASKFGAGGNAEGYLERAYAIPAHFALDDRIW